MIQGKVHMAVLTLPHAMGLIFSTLTYPILVFFFFQMQVTTREIDLRTHQFCGAHGAGGRRKGRAMGGLKTKTTTFGLCPVDSCVVC